MVLKQGERPVLRNVLRSPNEHAFDGGIIYGASLDGTNDVLKRGADLTGAADDDILTFVARFRMLADGTNATLLYKNDGRIQIYRHSGGKIIVILKNGSATTVVDVRSLTSLTADNNYHNLLFSVNLAATAISHLYLDDSDDKNQLVMTEGETIDQTDTDWGIGARPTTEANKFAGDMNFIWYDNRYFDFSTEANRRKFFDASGDPVLDVAGDGSVDAAQPLIYQAGTYDQWEGNKGSGGGFTVTGALTEPAN